MSEYNNPFASAGTIVEGNAFVGRQMELRDISERLFGEEFGNVAIVGIPKVGKSSLMHNGKRRRTLVEAPFLSSLVYSKKVFRRSIKIWKENCFSSTGFRSVSFSENASRNRVNGFS